MGDKKKCSVGGQLSVPLTVLLLMVGIGISATSTFGFFKYFSPDVKEVFYEALSYRFILYMAAGLGSLLSAVVMAISVNSRIYVKFTMFFVFLMMALAIVAASLGLSYYTWEGTMKSNLVQYAYNQPGYEQITLAYDNVEKNFQCYSKRMMFAKRDHYDRYSYYNDDTSYYCQNNWEPFAEKKNEDTTSDYNRNYRYDNDRQEEAQKKCRKYWEATGPARALMANTTLSCVEAFMQFPDVDDEQAFQSCIDDCHQKTRNDVETWIGVPSGMAIASASLQFLGLLLLFSRLPVFRGCCSGGKRLCCLPSPMVTDRKTDQVARAVPFFESTCSIGGKTCRWSCGVEDRQMLVEDDDAEMLIPPEEPEA